MNEVGPWPPYRPPKGYVDETRYALDGPVRRLNAMPGWSPF